VGCVGLLLARFHFKLEFGISVRGLSAFLLASVFSLMFDVVTVRMKCLVHAHMFQAHDENLKYARNTWTFSVMVVKYYRSHKFSRATLNMLQ